MERWRKRWREGEGERDEEREREMKRGRERWREVRDAICEVGENWLSPSKGMCKLMLINSVGTKECKGKW